MGPQGLTSGPRRIDGAVPTLFERLLGAGDPARDPDAPAPRVHDAAGLRAAVAAALGTLLSVRAPAGAAGLPAAARTVLDYGAAPDPALSAQREDDRNRLAAEIREAILAFEPRLDGPRVTVAPDPDFAGGAVARIEGRLRIGRAVEAFAFTAPLGSAGPAP